MASIGIPLSSLDEWALQRFTALVTATTQADFDRAFDNFVAKNALVTFNGAPLTREQYRQQIRGERFLQRRGTITMLEMVQAPKLNTHSSPSSGLVGIFYSATFIDEVNTLGSPAEHTVNSSLNMLVAPDASEKAHTRRVLSLNQVLVDKQSGPILASPE